MNRGESAPAKTTANARDISAPTHPVVSKIFAYWDAKRGTRPMPGRPDVDPTELRGLLRHIILYDVEEPGQVYRVRLVGSAIVEFYGVDTTGQLAGSQTPPDSAAQMLEILTGVVTNKVPRFRAGLTHWHKDRSFRSFEACFLPLSADGERVDKIFGGIAFDTAG